MVILASAAQARVDRAAIIEPSTRVNGMLVVQGRARSANLSLFGVLCDPVVLEAGRYRRDCGSVPRTSRLFVGYGIFASEASLERIWRASDWDMWIDGHRVDLDAFGTTDRWLVKYPPAGKKDVILREWSVTLVGATRGRHTIRYRTKDPRGTSDVTWAFTVAAR